MLPNDIVRRPRGKCHEYLLTIWLNGVVGATAVILGVLVWIFIKREQKKSDAEHQENIRLNGIIQDRLTLLGEKTIETTVTATQAIQAAIVAIQSSQAFLQSIQYQRDVAEAAKKVKDSHGQ